MTAPKPPFQETATQAVSLSTAIAQAQRLFERGEMADCIAQIAVVWPLLETNAQRAELGLLQVQALCELKLWQRAAEVLRQLIRLEPSQRIYWYNLLICQAEQLGCTAQGAPTQASRPKQDGSTAEHPIYAQLAATARMTMALTRQLPLAEQEPAWRNLCGLLQRYGLGQVLQQAAAYWQALQPQQAEPWAYAAMAHHALADFGQAHAAWSALEQSHPETMAEQLDWQMFAAQACLELRQHALALARYQAVLAREPSHPEALHNLAVVHSLLGQYDDSRAVTERALTLQPDSAPTRFKWALHLLREGHYAQGFQLYEARLDTEVPGSPLYERTLGLRDRGFALWRGEALDGKRLFVHPEQGHGDFLMMVRFLPSCLAAGAREVRYFMTGNLERYARALPLPANIIYQPIAHAHEIDIYTPLMSLPACLHIARPEDCGPPRLPLLVPTWIASQLATVQAQVQDIMRAQDAQACWGFTWRGSDQHPNTQFRNIPLDDFLTHLVQPLQQRGIAFVSLQKDATSAEQARLKALAIDTELIAGCTDWYDTAHVMQQLTGLVAVDTALVHLAGTLQKPVLMLNRHEGIADWRWLEGREDSPWYPSLRILSQTQLGQWDDVLQAACAHAIWQTALPTKA